MIYYHRQLMWSGHNRARSMIEYVQLVQCCLKNMRVMLTAEFHTLESKCKCCGASKRSDKCNNKIVFHNANGRLVSW